MGSPAVEVMKMSTNYTASAPHLVAMPTEQADALAAILAVTRESWTAAGKLSDGDKQALPEPDTATQRTSRQQSMGAKARSTALARLAARAFEAQVMAMRCRQAFVA